MTYQDARQRFPPQTDVTSREQQNHDDHTGHHQRTQQGGDQRVCRADRRTKTLTNQLKTTKKKLTTETFCSHNITTSFQKCKRVFPDRLSHRTKASAERINGNMKY